MTSGIPYREKIDFRDSIIAVDVVDFCRMDIVRNSPKLVSSVSCRNPCQSLSMAVPVQGGLDKVLTRRVSEE